MSKCTHGCCEALSAIESEIDSMWVSKQGSLPAPSYVTNQLDFHTGFDAGIATALNIIDTIALYMRPTHSIESQSRENE